MTRTVPLKALLAVYQDGDEHGWPTEFGSAAESDHYDELLHDIHANGIIEPIFLGNDGRVWDGHHRLAAAHTLGIENVPVIFSGNTEGD